MAFATSGLCVLSAPCAVGQSPRSTGPLTGGVIPEENPVLTLGGYLPACEAWLFPQNMQFSLWEKLLLLLGDLGQPLF